MGSLNVNSLFTNIILQETIDIYANIFFENLEKVEGLSKIKFKKLLFLTTKESYFIFNEKQCKQIDAVAMASPSKWSTC